MKLFFNVDKKKRKRGRHAKKRLHALHHFQEWFWPTIGGSALLRFAEIKLKRANGSAYSVAMSIAIGTFASFLPYIGLHSGIAIILALLLRASIVLSVVGTVIGNPWTFPFIWLTTLELGNVILGRTGDAAHSLPETFSFSELIENVSFYFDAYLLPMTVAGIPMGLVAGAVIFFIIYENIMLYRKARKAYLVEQRKKWLKITKHKEVAGKVTSAIKAKIKRKKK